MGREKRIVRLRWRSEERERGSVRSKKGERKTYGEGNRQR